MIAAFRLTNRLAGVRMASRNTEAEQEPIVSVQFSHADPVRCIELVEETLATIKARYLADRDKPKVADEDDDV